jgi:lysylphosphatidylglycerol synthetase-like protein (DUF2156 family)
MTTTAPAELDEQLLPVAIAPMPQSQALRYRQAVLYGLRRLRRAPFTIGFLLALWTVGVATGSVGHGIGGSLLDHVGAGWNTLATGHWWTPLSSILWCQNLSAYIWTTTVFITLVAPIEISLGPIRTAALLIGCQIGGVLLGTGIIRSAAQFDGSWPSAYRAALTVGPSIGAAGVILAGSARLSARWRRRLRLTVGLALVMFTVYIGGALDVLRLCGGVVGLVVGATVLRKRPRRATYAPSLPEARVLVALFIAILAVGPLLAYFSDGAAGPLSTFRPFPTVFVTVAPVLLLLVLAWCLAHSESRQSGQDAQAAAKARGILIRGGGSTLSHMTTWPGNRYWISADEQSAVAFRVISGIALTSGDPVGSPAARWTAVGEFSAYCDRNGWSPCFYNVTAEGRQAADELGWHSLQVAEDTVLLLPELSLSGKARQDVQTSLDKVGKAGITAQWWTLNEAPISVVEQVKTICEEWVADRGLPESGFALGGPAELGDPTVRCLIAVDEHQSVHAVTSWLPVYRDGAPVGWTLDFMRRRAGGHREVMEFLIAAAVLGFRAEGAEFLSLSGAPLARIDPGESPAVLQLQRSACVLGEALEPVYGFRSLLGFKENFRPCYQSLYLAYPDPAALSGIGDAISKAYGATGRVIARDYRSDARR